MGALDGPFRALFPGSPAHSSWLTSEASTSPASAPPFPPLNRRLFWAFLVPGLNEEGPGGHLPLRESWASQSTSRRHSSPHTVVLPIAITNSQLTGALGEKVCRPSLQGRSPRHREARRLQGLVSALSARIRQPQDSSPFRSLGLDEASCPQGLGVRAEGLVLP